MTKYFNNGKHGLLIRSIETLRRDKVQVYNEYKKPQAFGVLFNYLLSYKEQNKNLVINPIWILS